MKRVIAALAFVSVGITPSECGHGYSANSANVAALENVEVRARVQGTLDHAPSV